MGQPGMAVKPNSLLTCGAVRSGEEEIAVEDRAVGRAGLEGGRDLGL